MPTTGPSGMFASHRRSDDPTRLIPWLRGQSALFRDLPDPVFQNLFRHAKLQHWNRASVVLPEGHRARYAYVVVSGNVTVRVTTQGVSREIFAYAPGELCGLLGLLDPRPAPYDIVASTDCELILLDVLRASRLRACFHPTGVTLINAFLTELVEHLRALDERTAQLAVRKTASMHGTGQTYTRDNR